MIKNRGDKWTENEISLAKELYQKDFIISDIAPKVNHTDNAIIKKLKELGLTGNRRVLWTDNDIKQLKELFDKGLSYPEIGKIMNKSPRGCQAKAVRFGWIRKECNVWINNKRTDFWTDSEIEILKKSIADGLLMPDILKIINRSEKCIFNKMHELNLHLRERSEAEKAIYKRVYSVDDDYFENIDSQKKAYWLGWLVTDGYVISVLNTKRGLIKSNKIGLKLVYSDENVILDFNKDLKSTFPIEYLKEKSNLILQNNNLEEIKSKKQVCLELTSAKMIQDLAKYGIHQNKTYDVTFPKELDSKYYPGFIAGVISGDGCINIKLNHGKTYFLRCLIAGTYDLIDNIKNILVKEIGVNPDKKITKNKDSKCLYTLELNQSETIALYYWLQKNGISLMERKNKMIEEFLDERVKIPA